MAVMARLAPDLANANFGEGASNWFTGNLDFQRELDLLNRQQSFNAYEARKQRDYEERLSNTAYQRAVGDLESAGFNKGLLLGSASGASTPSGATATSPSSSHSSSGKGFGSLLSVMASLAGIAVGAFEKGADRKAKFDSDRSFEIGYNKGYSVGLYRSYSRK